MADASSLHCPNCGAAAQSDAGRCSYCRARLATVSCPSCFALMFAGAAFCEKCGARRARAERDDTSVKCPGCRSEFQQIAMGATTMLECGACDGVWVDADVFERVCADKETQAAVLHSLSRREAASPIARVQYRPCPRCGKMMNRVNFGKLSGTVVDVCKGHGTFLDAGELHQIVTFILEGGLERTRERQREELHDDERELQNAQHKAARARGGHGADSTDGPSMRELIEKIMGS